jgi:PST family polysaccharide transporter
MQDRPAEIGKHFVQTLSLIGLLCGPAMALTWGLRRPFIEVFLGSRWMEVANVLAWLAPVGYIQTLVINIGFVIIAIGRTKLLRNIGFVNSGVVVATFFLTVRFGILGVAAGYFAVNLVLGVGTLHVTLKTVDQNFFSLLRQIWRPLGASIFVGLAAWFADIHLTAIGMPPLLRLALIGFAGLAVYAGLLIILARSPLRQAIAFVKTGANSREQLEEKGIGVGNVT